MTARRRTKIIATLGPVSQTKEMLRRLVDEGVNVIRLNFSHGSHPEFAQQIANIRECEAAVGRPVAIMGDIQGPKMRVGKLAGNELVLVNDAECFVTAEPVEGGDKGGKIIIPVGYRDFVKDVSVGHTVLLDDGLIALRVIERLPTELRCRVINGGLLKPNKGINVPEAGFSARSITDKDYADILFCMEQGVDYIALSFVRTAQEVRHLKTFIESRGKNILVLAKIEKRDALTNLDEIIDASDGILVARGDLAVEIGNERVPVVQKKIVRKCNLRGKVVIIATQMLMSMVDNPRPTRAEASDVANAIVDGTDALMLSNETAVGKYPVETVRRMAAIARTTEETLYPFGKRVRDAVAPGAPGSTARGDFACVAAHLAASATHEIDVAAIVCLTRTGRTAMLLSDERPRAPIVALTADPSVQRWLALYWGVSPHLTDTLPDLPRLLTWATAALPAAGLAEPGDTVVSVLGGDTAPGATHSVRIATLGAEP